MADLTIMNDMGLALENLVLDTPNCFRIVMSRKTWDKLTESPSLEGLRVMGAGCELYFYEDVVVDIDSSVKDGHALAIGL